MSLASDDARAVMHEVWEAAVDLTRQLLLADWSVIALALFIVAALMWCIGQVLAWLLLRDE